MCPSREGQFCPFTFNFVVKPVKSYDGSKLGLALPTFAFLQNSSTMVLVAWHIRAPYEKFDPYEIHGKFSLKVHHGGMFVKFPGRMYVNGNVNYVDMLDGDEFSVHEIDHMLQKIGYPRNELMYYHFKIPGLGLDTGLRALGNDNDVRNLCQYVDRYKVIDVYVEHGVTRLDTYLHPAGGSNVVIEEIIEPSNPTRQLAIQWHDQEVVVEQNYHEGRLVEDEVVMNQSVDKEILGEQNYQDDVFIAQFIAPYVQDEAEVPKDQEATVEDDHTDDVEEESEDSDFIVDQDNMVEDVSVEMDEFRSAVEMETGDEGSEDDSQDEDYLELDLDDLQYSHLQNIINKLVGQRRRGRNLLGSWQMTLQKAGNLQGKEQQRLVESARKWDIILEPAMVGVLHQEVHKTLHKVLHKMVHKVGHKVLHEMLHSLIRKCSSGMFLMSWCFG